MKIFTCNYNSREEAGPALRAMLEALVKQHKIDDKVESIFIGRTSLYHSMEAKRLGQPVKPLTFPDGYIIVMNSNVKGANVQYTVANEFGRIYRRNTPLDIAVGTYNYVIEELKKTITKHLTVNNQEENINE